MGIFLVNLFLYGAGNNDRLKRYQVRIESVVFRRSCVIFFLVGVTLFVASQYFMGDANAYNLYIGNSVSAQVIEMKLKDAPFALNGVLILWAYTFILYYGICKQAGQSSAILTLTLLLSGVVFVSTGKLQSLLYLFFAMFFFTKKRVGFLKFLILMSVIVLIFSFTRIIRNPEHGLVFDVDFLLMFIGGFYFGSPVANGTYILERGFFDSQYIFTWLIPQKLVAASDISWSFPDQTSPIGFFSSAFLSFGFYGVIYVFVVGVISQIIYRYRYRNINYYIFYPFLFMSCFFSMMYNNFMNLTFFIIPFLMSLILPRLLNVKYVLKFD
ncbi:oligosaccharide repeat unit polymerase, partial [Aeromonas veronii]